MPTRIDYLPTDESYKQTSDYVQELYIDPESSSEAETRAQAILEAPETAQFAWEIFKSDCAASLIPTDYGYPLTDPEQTGPIFYSFAPESLASIKTERYDELQDALLTSGYLTDIMHDVYEGCCKDLVDGVVALGLVQAENPHWAVASFIVGLAQNMSLKAVELLSYRHYPMRLAAFSDLIENPQRVYEALAEKPSLYQGLDDDAAKLVAAQSAIGGLIEADPARYRRLPLPMLEQQHGSQYIVMEPYAVNVTGVSPAGALEATSWLQVGGEKRQYAVDVRQGRYAKHKEPAPGDGDTAEARGQAAEELAQALAEHRDPGLKSKLSH